MALKIETVGEFPTHEGKMVIGVLLVGPRDDVKKAARLWGEDVVLMPASDEMTTDLTK